MYPKVNLAFRNPTIFVVFRVAFVVFLQRADQKPCSSSRQRMIFPELTLGAFNTQLHDETSHLSVAIAYETSRVFPHRG